MAQQIEMYRGVEYCCNNRVPPDVISLWTPVHKQGVSLLPLLYLDTPGGWRISPLETESKNSLKLWRELSRLLFFRLLLQQGEQNIYDTKRAGRTMMMSLRRPYLVVLAVIYCCCWSSEAKLWRGSARLSASKPWMPLTSFAFEIGTGRVRHTAMCWLYLSSFQHKQDTTPHPLLPPKAAVAAGAMLSTQLLLRAQQK